MFADGVVQSSSLKKEGASVVKARRQLCETRIVIRSLQIN